MIPENRLAMAVLERAVRDWAGGPDYVQASNQGPVALGQFRRALREWILGPKADESERSLAWWCQMAMGDEWEGLFEQIQKFARKVDAEGRKPIKNRKEPESLVGNDDDDEPKNTTDQEKNISLAEISMRKHS
jgi:hypothetical protein